MQEKVNILFLGGAKRVSMARLFKDAGERMGVHVNLFSYELDRQVPIAEVATVIVGRRWRDSMLYEDLHDVVSKNAIDIMLPFVDPAVEVAAHYCAAYNDCWTPGSNIEMAALMFDKVLADKVFSEAGFPLPKNALAEPVSGRVIAKPRCGSASKGLKVLEAAGFEAILRTDDAEKYLFQEYVEHREEYTVDCYVSTVTGNVVCTVPRRRIEVSGGEVTVTETFHDEEIELWSRRILAELNLKGPVTIQFLREISSDGSSAGRLMLMEINPRFGGGAVCSVHSGADLPSFVLMESRGVGAMVCDDWQPGVRICRYMQEVVFNKGKIQF